MVKSQLGHFYLWSREGKKAEKEERYETQK